MDIKNLAYILEAYKCRSINKAAQNVYISQSHLSSIIKNVESEIGYAVFIRTPSGLTATDEGRYFLENAEKIVKNWSSILDVPDIFRDRNTLTICCTPSSNIFQYFLDYKELYPAKCSDTFLESGLKEMVEKYDAANGASGLIMNVNTGAVLAMASLPDYDLNDPWAIQDEKLLESLEGLEGDALADAKGAAQNKQWRNKNVNDTYEPGSTFKILTLSAALEEGVVNMNTQFTCNGSIHVPGWSKAINCSKRAGHGLQTLKVATGNSCNPAFITMGLKLGTSTYYQYMKDFGLMEATGIELNGEQAGIFASEEDFGKNVVSLAAYAFGQTCNVTPIALITAQAACVNGGYLRTPYLVEQILDDDGNIVFQHDSSTPVRQVISEDTSATVRECLEYVVSSGTGKNGQVAGYRIGGKTGTAETIPRKNGEYVVSFMGYAPADDPQIAIYVVVDRVNASPQDDAKFATGIVRNVLTEVLPYLNIFMTEELSEKEIQELAEKQIEITNQYTQKPEDVEDQNNGDGTGDGQTGDDQTGSGDGTGDAQGGDNTTPSEDWRNYPVDPATGYLVSPIDGGLIDPVTGADVGGDDSLGDSPVNNNLLNQQNE